MCQSYNNVFQLACFHSKPLPTGNPSLCLQKNPYQVFKDAEVLLAFASLSAQSDSTMQLEVKKCIPTTLFLVAERNGKFSLAAEQL